MSARPKRRSYWLSSCTKRGGKLKVRMLSCSICGRMQPEWEYHKIKVSNKIENRTPQCLRCDGERDRLRALKRKQALDSTATS